MCTKFIPCKKLCVKISPSLLPWGSHDDLWVLIVLGHKLLAPTGHVAAGTLNLVDAVDGPAVQCTQPDKDEDNQINE